LNGVSAFFGSQKVKMSSTVVQSTEFDTAQISFSQVKVLDSGGKQAYLNYGGRSLTMQTASMAVPYGMNVFDKAGPAKYSVDLSFRGYEDGSNKKIKAFYDAMTALDEFMIDQGVKNSQAWFKSKLSRDVVQAFYTPVVRIAKDANGNPKPYPPTLKISLKKRNGSDNFDVQAYDDQKRPYEGVPLEDLLVKGAQITALIQCTGVWFAGSKFGLSWKAVQVRVDRLPESIRGFAFADEEDAPASSTRRQAPAPAPAQAVVEEADDEQVDDDEVFSAPVKTPAKSVLAAVTPAPVKTMDDEAEDVEPVAVPKKAVVTKKKVVATAKKA
jgi:hypothetical protein